MTIDSLKEIDATIPQKSILKHRKSLHQKTTNLSIFSQKQTHHFGISKMMCLQMFQRVLSFSSLRERWQFYLSFPIYPYNKNVVYTEFSESPFTAE